MVLCPGLDSDYSFFSPERMANARSGPKSRKKSKKLGFPVHERVCKGPSTVRSSEATLFEGYMRVHFYKTYMYYNSEVKKFGLQICTCRSRVKSSIGLTQVFCKGLGLAFLVEKLCIGFGEAPFRASQGFGT